jgi:hypothetical protein
MIWGPTVLATYLAAAAGGIPAASMEAPIARARLELRAPSTCTGPADLIARVAARSPRIEFVADSSAVGVRATFTVARGVSAELVLVEAGVAHPQRRLVARTCAEAADAVALMIAVALDPGWVNEHRTSGTSESDPDRSPDRTSAASTVPQGTLRSGLAEKLSAKEPGRPSLPPQVPLPVATATDSTTTPAPRAQLSASAYLAGQTIWGPAPGTMPGVAAYAIVTMDHDALWSPAIAFGVLHAWRSDLPEPGGSASFSLDAATVDACVLRLRASRVSMRACAAALLGRLTARGSDTDAPATVPKFFAAAGAAAVFGLDLGSRVELSARIGTGLTLWRDSYEFATTVFHSTSRLTTTASLGVGLRLW